MTKILKPVHILYLLFFTALLVTLLANNVIFEPKFLEAVNQILHPENPKGELAYNPYYNFAYFASFLIKHLGCENYIPLFAKILWFLLNGLVVLALGKLCNHIFKDDEMILVLAVMGCLFLVSEGLSCVVDLHLSSKSALMPLYLLSVYFFLRERWFLSATFGSLIFYLHIGFAIWWLLPSFFGLCLIALTNKGGAKVSLITAFNYCLTTLVLAAPVLYYYFSNAQAAKPDEFFLRYYICTHTYDSSPWLLSHAPIAIMSLVSTVGVFTVGCIKSKRYGYATDNIVPIAVGVLVTCILTLVFGDILRIHTVVMLQLPRCRYNVELFSNLFLAFLLSRQVRGGNYIFLLSFVIIASYYWSIVYKFFGYSSSSLNITFIVFYAILLIYELFEAKILQFAKRSFDTPIDNRVTAAFKKVMLRINQTLQRPLVIAVLLICLILPRVPILKSFIKKTLKLPQQHEYASTGRDLEDIIRFTNQNINSRNTLLLIPFLQKDFEHYTKHNTFIGHTSPLKENDMLFKPKPYKIVDILKNDLDYPPEKFFESSNNRGCSDKNIATEWENIWKNLDETKVMRLVKKYKVTHIIREKNLPLNFPVLYQNGSYVVYVAERQSLH